MDSFFAVWHERCESLYSTYFVLGIIKSIFERINLRVIDYVGKDGRCYIDICFQKEVCYTGHGIERTKKGCYV